MTVACPFCTTRYLLPDHLLGPGGARVRCPSCGRSFVVPADSARPEATDPEVAALSGAPGRAPLIDPQVGSTPAGAVEGARAEEAAPTVTPIQSRTRPASGRGSGTPQAVEAPAAVDDTAVARAVLAALAEHHGEAIETAAASGRLFSEFGPAVFAAYDDYRHRAGKGARADAFRAALHERWHVDLTLPGEDDARH